MSDVRYTLRKLEFPLCAREALNRIEHLMTGRSNPSPKQLELALDLMREFVFCEIEYRDSRRPAGLNPLQELQLLDVLCEYFSGPSNDNAKNSLFLSFFGGPDSWRRMKFMYKLSSMAISASIAPVLLILGTWLQQTGCTSPQSLQLAQNLVRDYFILHPSHEGALKVLPSIAPLFVANFMTAVVEIYLKEGPGGIFSPPPKSLLELITHWVCSNPKLCFTAQPSTFTANLPITPVTPLAGLIQWCALAPLYITVPQGNDVEMKDYSAALPVKKIKLEKPIIIDENSPHLNDNSKISSVQTELQVYTKLHLGVLQSLHEAKRPLCPPTSINAQHLSQVVSLILTKIEQSHKPGNTSISESNLQLCLERVAQATQVALASGCVYGNIPRLLGALSTLPDNRILQIVIKHHHEAS